MFTRARLRLTLLYAALLSVTVLVVSGAIGTLAVQEARRTDDRELSISAAAQAARLPDTPPPSAPNGPLPPGAPDRRHLEEQGLLEWIIPAPNGQLIPPPFGTLPGLPDMQAAQQAFQSGTGRYDTITVQGSQVRVYSLPVYRRGQATGVVQVARSRYFVNAAVTRLALISLVAGLVGLVISGAAGYWLAGLTLLPIAVALERQRDFVADASHELRTPLTVMLTNAELLRLHPERSLGDYQDVVDDIIAETERMGRLVADLLTLARSDQGKAAVAIAPVNLSEVASAVARQFASKITEKGLAVETQIEPGVFVSGDQDRLHQLAVILFDNAVRYTPRGAVTVCVAREGNEAALVVSDTGPGIAAEHLPHLFERFYRTDAARSSEDGGAGLGLALAKWIAESHKGRIDVASTVDRGSTFTVRVPAVPIPDRLAAVAAGSST